MTERWRYVRPLLPVALALPFAGAAALSSLCIEPLSARIAGALSTVARGFSTATSAGEESELPNWAARPGLPPETPTEAVVSALASKQRTGTMSRRSARAAATSVFVPASSVLELVERGVRPRGSFVAPAAERPAGLLLNNVSALGIGLEDGDVLIEALGSPALDAATVIQAVVAARAQQARYLTGKIWRRGEVLSITVEQPYLPPT
jgi:hypothetical protein